MNNQQANAAPRESIPPREGQAHWRDDIEQTLALGEQFSRFAGGVIELARMEARLALAALPKILMLWLIMMPVMLLTWCAFSAFVAWGVFALSANMGLAIFSFLILQVVLLLSCRWLFALYRKRMTLPNTRAQLHDFLRSLQNEPSQTGQTEK